MSDTTTQLSWEQAKDAIAQKYTYKDFKELIADYSKGLPLLSESVSIIGYLNQAAELHANSVKQEAAAKAWIRVNDNLPEENTEVIVLINGLTGTAVYEQQGDIWQFVNERYDDFESEDVTHWQRLPTVKPL